MVIDNLMLFGKCTKKKLPNDYDFMDKGSGQRISGTSYFIFFETEDDIVTLKVSDEIYNAMQVGYNYVLSMRAEITTERDRSSGFRVNAVVKECAGDDEFTIVSLGDYNVASVAKSQSAGTDKRDATKETNKK